MIATDTAALIRERGELRQRLHAFQQELQQWIDSGQIHYEANQNMNLASGDEEQMPDRCVSIDSMVAGNVWEIPVEEGQQVKSGEVVAKYLDPNIYKIYPIVLEGTAWYYKCKSGNEYMVNKNDFSSCIRKLANSQTHGFGFLAPIDPGSGLLYP